MTVLIDWNMVRWLLSIICIPSCINIYKFVWTLCGLQWVCTHTHTNTQARTLKYIWKGETAQGASSKRAQLKYLTDTFASLSFQLRWLHSMGIEKQTTKLPNNEAAVVASFGICCLPSSASRAVPQTLPKNAEKLKNWKTQKPLKDVGEWRRLPCWLLPQYFIFFSLLLLHVWSASLCIWKIRLASTHTHRERKKGNAMPSCLVNGRNGFLTDLWLSSRLHFLNYCHRNRRKIRVFLLVRFGSVPFLNCCLPLPVVTIRRTHGFRLDCSSIGIWLRLRLGIWYLAFGIGCLLRRPPLQEKEVCGFLFNLSFSLSLPINHLNDFCFLCRAAVMRTYVQAEMRANDVAICFFLWSKTVWGWTTLYLKCEQIFLYLF